MDVTASILTIVQSVFVLAVRLKNLTNESRAHEEEVMRLQDRAKRHVLMIQASRNIIGVQARPKDGSPISSHRLQLDERLKEAALTYEKDFKRFKQELSILWGEGTRQNVELMIWGRTRLKPAIDKIKDTIGEHEHELGLLMHLHHGIVLEELSRIIGSRRLGQSTEESEEIDLPNMGLQPAPTFGSMSSEATLIGRTSRESSFSVETGHAASPSMGGNLFPIDEKKKAKNKSEMPQLLRAISQGDKDLVNRILNQGADIRARDSNERTVLHCAMKNHNSEALIQLLLDRNSLEDDGLDLNAVDDEENTALHKCAEYNKSSVAKMLLGHGACPEVQDGDGKTPLYCAIQSGYYEVVEVLLDGGTKLSEEYHKIKTNSHIKKLLLSRRKEMQDDQPKKETTRKNSRKISIISSRRGSGVKA